jgi:hypothetical protein
VEENMTDPMLTIRLASNTGDCSRLLDGFKDISKILEKASARGEHTNDLLLEGD